MELCFSVVFAFTYISEHLEYLEGKPLSFSLKNVMLTLSEQEPVSCCLSCVAPEGGEYFEMGQGFHCEPVIVFQTVWGSGGARKCVRVPAKFRHRGEGRQSLDAEAACL